MTMVCITNCIILLHVHNLFVFTSVGAALQIYGTSITSLELKSLERIVVCDVIHALLRVHVQDKMNSNLVCRKNLFKILIGIKHVKCITFNDVKCQPYI